MREYEVYNKNNDEVLTSFMADYAPVAFLRVREVMPPKYRLEYRALDGE